MAYSKEDKLHIGNLFEDIGYAYKYCNRLIRMDYHSTEIFPLDYQLDQCLLDYNLKMLNAIQYFCDNEVVPVEIKEDKKEKQGYKEIHLYTYLSRIGIVENIRKIHSHHICNIKQTYQTNFKNFAYDLDESKVVQTREVK